MIKLISLNTTVICLLNQYNILISIVKTIKWNQLPILAMQIMIDSRRWNNGSDIFPNSSLIFILYEKKEFSSTNVYSIFIISLCCTHSFYVDTCVHIAFIVFYCWCRLVRYIFTLCYVISYDLNTYIAWWTVQINW